MQDPAIFSRVRLFPGAELAGDGGHLIRQQPGGGSFCKQMEACEFWGQN